MVWSFEYFPPRTAQGLQNLYDRIERMRLLGPEFIDITWGAGGKNSDLTLSLVQMSQQTIGMETCMHLCCTEMPEQKVKESLKIAKDFGCQNILALRGDPANGQATWTATEGGFSKAIDLVRYIRSEYGDYFDIAVAGFPQGHPETEESAEAQRLELQYLKEKVDAGANFIFTQMFYDFDIFSDWVKRVRAAGIDVPIVPGIMPIQSWQKFTTWVEREKIVVPPHFYDVLLPVKDDDEKVRAVGTKLVGEMCRQILESDLDICGLHVYTLNLEKGATMLLDSLGLDARREQVQPFPWRPSLTPNRRAESIRPIFWANRPGSYLSRTDSWDEFPNGRWGDSRSPAYGDLDGYPVTINITRKDAHEIWGQPKTFSDICSLFAKFCRNELRALPWSSRPPSKETHVINQQLARMNELGYLTINSQPAVDGAPSDDPTYGWGPKNGYVYQKAYLEFFVAPSLLNDLVRRIEKDPRITYYAVNRQGDLRTNTHSEGPNAVTWGVYPGKEIVQPTIVEAVSFVAWKDEAFELGMQWANLYDPDSPSRELIADIMESSYLVNIVANDFKDGASIFEPFQLEYAAATSAAKPNGLPAGNEESLMAQVKGAQPSPSEASLPEVTVNAPNGDVSSSVVSGPVPRKPKTMADLEDVFDSTPLFMREMPADGGENNTALEALKSLVFDGTADEIALNFKNNGVKSHQEGQLREALGFYTQGLEAQPEDAALRESLLLNRAACNLSLRNYASALKDTSVALMGNPVLAKAYFRASSALLALSRWEDALDCIERGRRLPDESAADKQNLWANLKSKAEAGLQFVAEKAERERRERVGNEALKRAINYRGILHANTPSPPDNPHPAHFDPNGIPEAPPLVQEGAAATENKWYPPTADHAVIFSAFLLYPSASTSDLITQFHEDATFGDQLEVMFPASSQGGEIPFADWDSEREYFCDNLVVYAETSSRKLLKVGKSLTLREVIARAAALSDGQQKDGLVMRDGLLSFFVLPKGTKEKQWVDRYKASRAGA